MPGSLATSESPKSGTERRWCASCHTEIARVLGRHRKNASPNRTARRSRNQRSGGNRETEKQRWERRNHCQSLDGKVHPNPFFVSFAPFVVNSTHLVSHDQIKENHEGREDREGTRRLNKALSLATIFLDCQINFAQDAKFFTVSNTKDALCR